MFALHNGGECRSGYSNGNIFKLHGKSRGCHKGIGNHISNHVYHMKKDGKNGHSILICFNNYQSNLQSSPIDNYVQYENSFAWCTLPIKIAGIYYFYDFVTIEMKYMLYVP